MLLQTACKFLMSFNIDFDIVLLYQAHLQYAVLFALYMYDSKIYTNNNSLHLFLSYSIFNKISLILQFCHEDTLWPGNCCIFILQCGLVFIQL